jgi:glutamate synthase (NADPH/NADH) large chain
LISEHAKRTGSPRAAQLLANWDAARGKFWQICPTEMIPRLKHALSDGKDAAAAA